MKRKAADDRDVKRAKRRVLPPIPNFSALERHFISFDNNASPFTSSRRIHRLPRLTEDVFGNNLLKIKNYGDGIGIMLQLTGDVSPKLDVEPLLVKKLRLYLSCITTATCYRREDAPHNCTCESIRRVETFSSQFKRMKFLEEFSVVLYLPGLETAVRQGLEKSVLSTILEMVPGKRLKKLKIKSDRFTDEDIRTLSSYMLEIKSLKTLKLACEGKLAISPLDTFFGPMAGNPSLEVLILGGYITPEASGFDQSREDTFSGWWDFLKGNTSLKSLSIAKHISDDVAKMLLKVTRNCTNLETLQLNIFPKKLPSQLSISPKKLREPLSMQTSGDSLSMQISELYDILKDHPAAFAIPYIHGRLIDNWNSHFLYIDRQSERCVRTMEFVVDNIIAFVDTNKTIRTLLIEDTVFTKTRAAELTSVLQRNTTITSMTMRNTWGFEAINVVSLLEKNKTLKTLSLCFSGAFEDDFTARDFLQIAEHLKTNNTLTALELHVHNIDFNDDVAVGTLCELIETNTSLNYLNITNRHVYETGPWHGKFFLKIVKAIKNNATLWEFKVSLDRGVLTPQKKKGKKN